MYHSYTYSDQNTHPDLKKRNHQDMLYIFSTKLPRKILNSKTFFGQISSKLLPTHASRLIDSLYPGRHIQLYEPITLRHSPFRHGSSNVSHSLISKINTKCVLQCLFVNLKCGNHYLSNNPQEVQVQFRHTKTVLPCGSKSISVRTCASIAARDVQTLRVTSTRSVWYLAFIDV